MNEIDELRYKELKAQVRFLDGEVYLNYKQQQMLKNQFDDLVNQLLANRIIDTRPSPGDISDEEALERYEWAENRLFEIRSRLRARVSAVTS